MSWIKRNPYFLACCVVALGLMGWGGFYLYTAVSGEREITQKIAESYKQLSDLYHQTPSPGSGDTDNIKAAKEQRAEIEAYIKKAGGYCRRPAAIPDEPKVINADFAAQLRNTVAQLEHDAANSSVQLPHDYYFTFESQRHLMLFDPASLDKMAVRLGEIKAICDVLLDAKINALDGIRRELVSTPDDKNATDYLGQSTTVTPLAEMTPYEVTFRCFSTELAAVLSGLANSPYCFLVKTINVEPAVAAAAATQDNTNPQPPPVTPTPIRLPGKTFLTEQQLRVTLLIEVVKLKPTK